MAPKKVQLRYYFYNFLSSKGKICKTKNQSTQRKATNIQVENLISQYFLQGDRVTFLLRDHHWTTSFFSYILHFIAQNVQLNWIFKKYLVKTTLFCKCWVNIHTSASLLVCTIQFLLDNFNCFSHSGKMFSLFWKLQVNCCFV